MNRLAIVKERLIEGKVAGFLNERDLTINIGSHQGVRVGMKFKVVSQQTTEVRDPDTNEVLGIVEREKVRVQVTEVYDKFSICRTYQSLPSAYRPLIEQSIVVEQALQLEALEDNNDYYIQKGDRVVQLPDDE